MGQNRCKVCGIGELEHSILQSAKPRRNKSRSAVQQSSRCISCGRDMDLRIYYTVCPHCGFNYRIQISPSTSEERISLEAWGLRLALVLAAFSGFFVATWLLLW